MSWSNTNYAISVASSAPWLRQIYLYWPRYGFWNYEQYYGTFQRLSEMFNEEISHSPGTTWLYKAYKRLPANYCNEATAEDAELLYVGISENPLARFAAHSHSPTSPWTDLTNWVSLHTFHTRHEALAEEKRVIQTFAPGANVAGQNSFGVWADQKRIPWTCDYCSEQDGPNAGWQASDLLLAVIFGDQEPKDGWLPVRFVVGHDECLGIQQDDGILPIPIIIIELWKYRTLDELSLLRRAIEQIPAHQRNSHRATVSGTMTWEELVQRAICDVRNARARDGFGAGVIYNLRRKVLGLDSLLPAIGVE